MRIGIIGAGQLGQMLGFAARDLGLQCHYLDPAPEPPAAVCGPVLQAAFDDQHALALLAAGSDVLTYEFENVPVDALQDIRQPVTIYPPPQALRHAQDRFAEKQLFEKLQIALPMYRCVDTLEDLRDAAAALRLPLVLKTRRLGYDGKGQCVIREPAEIGAAWESCGGKNLITEQWIDFDFEVSIIGVRNVAGDIVTYPLTRNEHRDGILRVSRAPLENAVLTRKAKDYVSSLLEHLDYVGVLTLELFVVGDQLLANEFAPRVHNSGHWTIEGADPSQFTAHLLAITGQPLTTPQMRGHAGMLNLIGSMPPSLPPIDGASLHDYGKQPRAGRKLGHVTVIGDSPELRDQRLEQLQQIVTQSSAAAGTET